MIRMIFGLLLAVCVLQAAPAAAKESMWRVSATGGLLSEKKFAFTKTKEGSSVGVEVARKLGSVIELGADISYAPVSYETTVPFLGTVEMDINNIFALLSLNFRPTRGLYLGVLGGVTDRALKLSSGPGDINMTAGTFGFKAGYDLFLSERFTIGVQAQHLSVGKSEKTLTDNNQSVTYKLDSTSFTKYLLAIGYRF